MGYRTIPLGEIAANFSRPFSFAGREEVVFVNTGDVLTGKFLHHDCVSPAGLPGQAKKRIEKGDILYSEIRPANGRFALVDFDADKYVVSTKFMVIRPTSDSILTRFLYLQLTAPEMLREMQLIAESRSGTFPQITFDAVSYLPVVLPDISTQKAIVETIGALDDKIELNRRMNGTLEALAQTVFKEWFMEKAGEGWAETSLAEQVEVTKGLSYKGSGLADAGQAHAQPQLHL